MLNAFATRLDVDNAPKDAVKAMQLFARDRTIARVEKRDFRGNQRRLEEQQRIERQRTLFAMVPDTSSLTRLKEAMLQRAYDCMWDGDPASCDALLEFLPEKDADKLLDAWSNDWEAEGERSHWYGGQK